MTKNDEGSPDGTGEPSNDTLLASNNETLKENLARVKENPRPDLTAIRDHLKLLHEHAALLARDHDDGPGVLVLISQIPDAAPWSSRFNIGHYESMAESAFQLAEKGYNVYAPWRTIRRDTPARSTGTAEDTVIPIALAVDMDRVPYKGLDPSLTIETSPGHQHNLLLLDRLIPPAEARDLGRRLRAATGTDTITGSLTFAVRIPGTLNYPNETKRAAGRGIEMVRLAARSPRTYSPDELRAVLPEVHVRPRNADGTTGDDAINRLLMLHIFSALPNDDAHYDDWLYIGMALQATGWPDAFQMWDEWSRKSKKYRQRKQLTAWKSFKPDGGVTIGTIFYLAEQCGWSYIDASNAIFDQLEFDVLEAGRNAPELRAS